MNESTKYPKHAKLLNVRQVTHQAEGINSYELVHPEGHDLPPFQAGAHIDFYFRDGSVRQYSLCNDPQERHRYLIAVLRLADGRGGSEALHKRVHVQRSVYVGEVRNNFPLHEEAEHHLLLAGGIGVTPMMGMIAHLQKIDANFTMHYCTKSPKHTAFLPELAELIEKGQVTMHYDGGIPGQGLDISDLLAKPASGTHLYYCGPPGFMRAVERSTSDWPEGSVHFEYFSAAKSPKSSQTTQERDAAKDSAVGIGFQVQIASSGATFFVPNDKSILDVLSEHGIEVEASCKSGLCGTCTTRYLKGEVDHRDLILDHTQQADHLTICCSRAKSDVLVLDL
jgi:vanillate O-demethylase ferredoxin subunit